MNNTNLKWNPAGLGCAMLAGVVWMQACGADAGHRYCAPYRAAAVIAAPSYYYQVAPQLQQEAVATAGYRASDQYAQDQAELSYLRGVAAGVEKAAAIAQAHSQLEATQEPQQQPQPMPAQGPYTGEQPAEQMPAPPQAPQGSAQPFAAMYPTLLANCSKCHTGDSPKGDLWIDGSTDLAGPDATEKRDKIMRMVLHLQMPPKGAKPLNNDEFEKILSELYPVQDEPAEPAAPPATPPQPPQPN